MHNILARHPHRLPLYVHVSTLNFLVIYISTPFPDSSFFLHVCTSASPLCIWYMRSAPATAA